MLYGFSSAMIWQVSILLCLAKYYLKFKSFASQVPTLAPHRGVRAPTYGLIYTLAVSCMPRRRCVTYIRLNWVVQTIGSLTQQAQ